MPMWKSSQFLRILLVGCIAMVRAGKLVSSSVFQMTLGPSTMENIQNSIRGIESSIAVTLLESSSDQTVVHMEAQVQDIDDSAQSVESNSAKTVDVDFNCIGSFQDEKDTALLDSFILETFSTLSSVKRFKRLLDSTSQVDFSGISTVVVVPLSEAEKRNTSSGKHLNKLDITLIIICGTIVLVMLVVFRLYRKERSRGGPPDAHSQPRCQSRRNDRRCAPIDQHPGSAKTAGILEKPPSSPRRTLDMDPIYLEAGTPAAKDCPPKRNSIKGDGLSEAFSKNCFRNKDDDCDMDSADDVFHVGDVQATRESDDDSLRTRRALLDWARCIQVMIQSTEGTKQESDLYSDPTSTTERLSASQDEISLDGTSISGISEAASLESRQDLAL